MHVEVHEVLKHISEVKAALFGVFKQQKGRKLILFVMSLNDIRVFI